MLKKRLFPEGLGRRLVIALSILSILAAALATPASAQTGQPATPGTPAASGTDLVWTQNEASVDVRGWNVYFNGSYVDTVVENPRYAMPSNAREGTYYVVAFDFSTPANFSDRSPEVQLGEQSQTGKPATPGRPSVSGTDLVWTQNEASVDVRGWNVYYNDNYVDTVTGTARYAMPATARNGTYYVVAFDTGTPPTFSDRSPERLVGDDPVQIGKPATPSQPTASGTNLIWNQSEANVDVRGWNVYFNNNYVDTVIGTPQYAMPANARDGVYYVVAFDFSTPSVFSDRSPDGPVGNQPEPGEVTRPENVRLQPLANGNLRVTWNENNAIFNNVSIDGAYHDTASDSARSLDIASSEFPNAQQSYVISVQAVANACGGCADERYISSAQHVYRRSAHPNGPVAGIGQLPSEVTAAGNFVLNADVSDEFNDNSLDASKWDRELPWGAKLRINAEEQYYADAAWGNNDSPYVMTGSELRITPIATPAARQGEATTTSENVNGTVLPNRYEHEYVSGAITGRQAVSYGYYESRMKLPPGAGMWPAFWLYARSFNQDEIDIMEAIGQLPTQATTNYHTNNTDFGATGVSDQFGPDAIDFSSSYHTFGVLWTETEITYFLDGEPVANQPTISPAQVTDEDMFLIANLAIGGGFPTYVGEEVANDLSGRSLNIDYIRFYEQSTTPPPPADSVAPSRPGFGSISFDRGEVTWNWGASTDNVGVTGYRAWIVGTDQTQNLGPNARSATFNLRRRDGQYVVRVVALDAAGNESTTRSSGFRLLSDADLSAMPGSVADVTAALEQWMTDNGNTNWGGSGGLGRGWANYRYQGDEGNRSINNLVAAGYLDASYQGTFYWDMMIYNCGSGQNQKAAVFAVVPGVSTPSADASDWSGCTTSPTSRYGHEYFNVTQTIGQLQSGGDTEAPSRPGFRGISYGRNSVTFDWNASSDNIDVVGYRAWIHGTTTSETLGANARSVTFSGLPQRDGRYIVRVVAVDAAGNESELRQYGFRLQTDPDLAAMPQAVADVTSALEQWMASNGDTRWGGSQGAGNGWANYSYQGDQGNRSINSLIAAGFLDASYQNTYYWDMMIYTCGSGQNRKAAVFAVVPGVSTPVADVTAWNNCTTAPLRHGHDYFTVTQTMGQLAG